MKLNFNYRENHEELLSDPNDSTEIYKKSITEVGKRLEFLDVLLKNQDGELSIIANDSWYGYNIYINYKGYEFRVNDMYGKLHIHIPSYYKYTRSVDSRFCYFPKQQMPQNYTFFKLTTKKLLISLDYEIEKSEEYKKYSEKQSVNELKKYEKAKEDLKFIAESLDVELQISKHGYNENIEETRIYLSDFYQVNLKAVWNESLNNTEISYEIKQFVKLVSKLKNKFSK